MAKLRTVVKDFLTKSEAINGVYGLYQSNKFDAEYRNRFDHYNRLTIDDSDSITLGAHKARLDNRLKARGCSSKKRSIGNVRTCCFIPSNWSHQNQIYNAIETLGPSYRFDYKELGYDLQKLTQDKSGEIKERIAEEFLKNFQEMNAEYKFDWIFCYATPFDMTIELLNKLKEKSGIPIINISLDDKNWWNGIHRRNPETGLVNLVRHFDATWTSTPVSVPWHWHEGGVAFYLPEGVNSDVFAPDTSVETKFDVVFIGSRFGYRNEMIQALRRYGVNILTAGPGWNSGVVSSQEMIRLFNSARIILGIGDMSYSKWLTNLKGRDFEAPSIGRGVYLTTYNRDLSQCFEIGKEIYCYRGLDEMIESIIDIKRNVDHVKVGIAARHRCMVDHQWKHRFVELLTLIKVL